MSATNGSATKTAEAVRAEEGPAVGRPFVRAGQRFISVLGTRQAWTAYFAMFGLMALGILAIFGNVILNLQNQLALRQPIVVGMTTAHQIVPLFPDGTTQAKCDPLCIDGQIELWISSLRKVTGETDEKRPWQHEAQDIVGSMTGAGSQADDYAKRYYRTFDPYVLADRGLQLKVVNAHVTAAPGNPNQYEAHWTDVVSRKSDGQEIGRHPFSASLTATAEPTAREESKVIHNPVGVIITTVEQFGDMQ